MYWRACNNNHDLADSNHWTSLNGVTPVCIEEPAITIMTLQIVTTEYLYENHHNSIIFLKCSCKDSPTNVWRVVSWFGLKLQLVSNTKINSMVSSACLQPTTQWLKQPTFFAGNTLFLIYRPHKLPDSCTSENAIQLYMYWNLAMSLHKHLCFAACVFAVVFCYFCARLHWFKFQGWETGYFPAMAYTTVTLNLFMAGSATGNVRI